MTLTVNIAVAKRMAFKGLAAGLVPMLWGPPAIGKSAITHQIAQENNLFLIDERLSDCDPTDMKGFPSINEQTGKGFYRAMETFPLEGDPIPAGFTGWLLFLDELTNADDDVRKAAYKLVLDRKVGQKNLHERVVIVCAGNGIEHGAMANELGTAMQSRLMHIDVELSFDAWKTWAMQQQIDQRILDFLNFGGGKHLYTFSADHTDKTFAAPRTWEFADKYIKVHGFDDEDLYASLAGLISPGVASEFMNFCTVYKDLPKIEDILSGPEWAKIPEQLSAVFAVCGMVSQVMDNTNVEKLLVYIKRMGAEFMVVTMLDAMKRNPSLKQNPKVREWGMQNGHMMF